MIERCKDYIMPNLASVADYHTTMVLKMTAEMCIRDRGAILQYEVVGIAERLLTGYMAIHQPEIVRMPAEIFAVEFRIVDCHILHLPEEMCIRDSISGV